MSVQKLNENSKGIEVTTKTGAFYEDTFYVIDKAEYNGQTLYLLENEEYGDEQPCIIVDEYNNVILEDIYNGFDDYIEQREDLVEMYDIEEPLLFYDNANKVNITNKYTLPYDLKFIDSENNILEYYVGSINGTDLKLFVKTEEGNILYSGKLDKEFENAEFNLSDTLNIDNYSFRILGNINEINPPSEVVVHFRYKEEKNFAGFTSYTDSLTFCDMIDAMKFVNKTETVYDWLDNICVPNEDEIPLYITSNSEEKTILWENEEFVNKLIEEIKDGTLAKEDVMENIHTLSGSNIISKFDICVFGSVINASALAETVYEKGNRSYHGYLTDDKEKRKCPEYYLEFSQEDIEKIYYNGELVKEFNKEADLKYSTEMIDDIKSLYIDEPTNIITNLLQIIGEYEKCNNIPTDNRITSWFGDYAIFEAKTNITTQDIIKKYIEVEENLKMELPSAFTKAYDYYDLIKSEVTVNEYMRCQLPFYVENSYTVEQFTDYLDTNKLKDYTLNEFLIPLKENKPVICVSDNNRKRYIEIPEHAVEIIRYHLNNRNNESNKDKNTEKKTTKLSKGKAL